MRPELEVFDTGHLVLVKELIEEGLIDDPVHDPALHGHPLRRARRPAARFMAMVNNLPAGCGVLRLLDRPDAAAVRRQAALAGGNVRVGLEDNL